MTGALAKQLQQLRKAGASSKRRTGKLLYDQREVACFDDETVYNLAWNGLLELMQLDARFEELDTDVTVVKLFSHQRAHFHRAQSFKWSSMQRFTSAGCAQCLLFTGRNAQSARVLPASI